ncbi:MAG: S8/S53 family peptidase [Chloroflexi bacterium]|nr:S8/S53 family peptidase [Chloroflexota bacterium]
MHIRLPFTALTLTALLTLIVPSSASTVPFASSPAQAAGSPPVPNIHHLGPFVPLPGSVLKALGSARRLAPLAASTPIGVAVSLRVRDEAGLSRFLADVYNPRSPLYHHFLTPRQFEQRFGPTPAQQKVLVAWLQSRHLRVTQLFRNGLLVTARGSARQIESAFHTSLSTFRQSTPGTRSLVFFSNDRPVQVPEQLARQIVSVSGLSNRPAELPLQRREAAPRMLNGFQGYGPSDLTNLYDIQQIIQTGDAGSGQTIALYEKSDFSDANISQYDSSFGLSTTPPERVAVGDGSDTGASRNDGQGEAELDIEIVHAIAPAAHLLVYEAPQGKAGSIAMWNKIVSDDRAQVVSTSWGSPETYTDSDEIQAIDQALQEAAAQGQSVFDASGDLGAYDLNGIDQVPKDEWTKLVADFPGTDPWITAVGGTTLEQNSDGSYGGERAWSDVHQQPNVGSGGGLSTVFKRPSWQSGPGVDNQYSNGMRQMPDVAADADANRSPYAIYTVDDQGQPGWQGAGGTSASAPLWAATLALINQYLGQPQGFLNPTLYRLGQQASTLPFPPFHDITEGNNLYYPATPGWDFATGWGSLDATAMLVDLWQMSSQ